MVRFLLAQIVVNVLRRDGTMRAWYKQIKRRRGSKIARVAVMRRLAVIMWYMLTKREVWQPGMPALRTRPDPSHPRTMARESREAVDAWLGEMQAASKPAEESTGSSSLSPVTEEVEACQA